MNNDKCWKITDGFTLSAWIMYRASMKINY